ncbi:MAG: hypothetical protein IGS38_10535 [Synechococcales cyanobacterium M58_A2018_015]|nr:hypothetical protein [Synechococcales cyanobacterium M58_A2018_015]
MVRGVLLLLLAAGLVLFAVQNLSPITLVVLGAPTLALPLSVWILGAMAAGALTTVLIAALAGGSRPAARRETARADFAAGSERSDWSAGWAQRPPSQVGNDPPRRSAADVASTSRRSEDDWDTHRSEEWDDWEVAQPASRRPAAPSAEATAKTAATIRDTADDDWANWEGYEDVQETAADAPRPQPAEPVIPRRTDFEVKQEPTSRSQTGSIYSYSYRKPEPQTDVQPPNPFQEPTSESLYEKASDSVQPSREPVRDTAAPRRDPVQGNVYDAEYRVIIPPFSADPPPAPEIDIEDLENLEDLEDLESPDDDEDWGLDEEDELPPGNPSPR